MKVKLFVPTQNKQYIRHLAERVTNQFNGCTIYPKCEGFWLITDKHVVKDKIVVIEVFVGDGLSLENVKRKIVEIFVRKIKSDLNQQCVAFSVNNKIYFE